MVLSFGQECLKALDLPPKVSFEVSTASLLAAAAARDEKERILRNQIVSLFGTSALANVDASAKEDMSRLSDLLYTLYGPTVDEASDPQIPPAVTPEQDAPQMKDSTPTHSSVFTAYHE